MQKASVGRIVHYVMPNGAHRPALVVADNGGLHPNLQVFLDVVNDKINGNIGAMRADCNVTDTCDYGNTFSVYSRAEDSTGLTPGTWHWPEREG